MNLSQSDPGSDPSSSFINSPQVSCGGKTDPGPALAAMRVQRETGYHGEGGRAGGPPPPFPHPLHPPPSLVEAASGG